MSKPEERRRIFDLALSTPVGQRPELLDRECGDDASLRAEVEAMLREAEPPDENSEAPTVASASVTPTDPRRLGPGTTIGPYRLLALIGEGGFGSVYMAEQDQPVRRRVALKILKLGMDTQAVIGRFEQERQALAAMDHPHIAKVLDAGATESGRPYFVMELVTGRPMTTYADEQRLTLRQRLELFVQVCNAIQHAHSKGIIHRDIKPSNVLVSSHDGRPFARVIDFGIAKAIDQRLSDETAFTQHGQLMGTPLYMSPEQAEGSLDIDTRSDVYSLGVLLYEVLTGTTPLDPRSLRVADYGERYRMIRESDPPRPSSRIVSSTATLPAVAESRRTAPDTLRSLLRGELDWIAMKALEKDRARRYETVNGLSLDVQRYLAGEPVAAAPASATYRLRKLAARHKGPVIAAAAVAVAMVVGLAGTLWQATVADRERDAAQIEAARATALNDFMAQMLTAADPAAHGNREVTVAEVLERASAAAEENLHGQPAAEADARTLLGNTFQSLGKVDEAVQELERALALRRQVPGPPGAALAGTLRSLARSYDNRGQYDEAVAVTEEAISILATLGPSARRDLAGAYWEAGRSEFYRSRYPEAEQDVEISDEILGQLTEDVSLERAQNLTLRGSLENRWKGDIDRAAELLTEALAIQRRNGDPFNISDGLSNLALVEMERGRLEEAAAQLEESVEITRDLLGDASPSVALRLENLANVRYRQGDYEKTAELLGEVLAIRVPVYGADSFPVAKTRFNTGVVSMKAGQYERALELIDQAIPVFREHTGDQSFEMVGALHNRGKCRAELGDDNGALADFRTALAIADRLDTPATPGRLGVLTTMTAFHCQRGDRAAAAATANLVLEALEPDNPAHERWRTAVENQLAACGG
ncbi:MAG TPA: tetratricopeptide repeat protein [Chondromyces sp.]|nr:tetratricopeptide repeat protein [Chondromyces sp.]